MHARARFWKPLLISLGGLCVCSTIVCAKVQSTASLPNRPEAISVIVSPFGFATSKMSLPVGTYAFVVLNRSGYEDITIGLERMPENNVNDTPTRQEFVDTVGANRARLVRNVTLTQGTYRLRAANRPTWLCAIHVN